MANHLLDRIKARGWKCNRCGSQDLRERGKTFLICKACGFTNSKNAMSYKKNKRHSYYKEEA